MYVHLDYHSGEPIYRQIVEQVKYLVALGRLADGERLPSIRRLARQLKINPRTVVRAYEQLHHAGLVVMRHGQGVFVTAGRGTIPADRRDPAIAGLACRLLAEARRMGATNEEILAILAREAERMEMGLWTQR